MTAWHLGLLCAVALLLLPQLARTLGRGRGALLGLAGVAALAGGWGLLGRGSPEGAAPADWAAVESVPSDACAKCHQDHYDSWYRTYHRTMTREATPEHVQGDFDNAVYDYQGLKTRLTRAGYEF